MLDRPWWELWPHILERQLKALEAAGIPFERDEEAARLGILTLHLRPILGDRVLRLIAVFPELFPYFRFEVYAPEMDLAHHQHPFGKNLCFIGRASENWSVDDTLAQYIVERLPDVLAAGLAVDGAAVVGVEQRQAEPFSDYYPYQPDAAILIDGAWTIDDGVVAGELLIGVEARFGGVLRGAVLEVRGPGGRRLAEADAVLHRRYTTELRARWVRVTAPIAEHNAPKFIEALGKQHDVLDPRAHSLGQWRVDVVGVLFPDEVEYRTSGEGWVFCVRSQPIHVRRRDRWNATLVRAERAGRQDLRARVPETAPLADRRVAIIGLGGIGAPSALELARAGVGELRLLDHDMVQAGTAVRWPFGLRATGYRKAPVLARFIEQNYPYTNVRVWVHRVGGASLNGTSDINVVRDLVQDVDLVYDCSAEVGLHHFFSDVCRQRGIPFIAASTTPGAWGGRLVRFRPGQTPGCWGCYLHGQLDGSIPVPPEDGGGTVQPQGCADPTFTGAGFDVATIALQGVRLVASTLAGSATGGYPAVDWDVAVIALRDEDGRPVLPRCDTFALPRHPKCECWTR